MKGIRHPERFLLDKPSYLHAFFHGYAFDTIAYFKKRACHYLSVQFVLRACEHKFEQNYGRGRDASFRFFVNFQRVFLQPVIPFNQGKKEVRVCKYHKYFNASLDVSFFIASIVTPFGIFLPSASSAFIGSLGSGLSRIPLSVSMATNFCPYLFTASAGNVTRRLSSVTSISTRVTHY